MRTKQILDTTTNSRVYKHTHAEYINEKVGGCKRCSLNRGCNRRYKDNRERSWKSHRKTQWK